MRGGIAIAITLVVGFVACSPVGFVCEGDDDCVLSGQPGVCLGEGQCAYPDPECPSGLSYPQGAPDERAGECVSGDPVATGTEGSGSGSSDDSSGAPPPPQDTGASSTTSDDPRTTGDDDPSTGSSTGALDPCTDPTEPNDEPAAPDTIDFQRCAASWNASLESPDDLDWFILVEPMGGCDLEVNTLLVSVSPGVEVCAVPRCVMATPVFTDCSGVETMAPDGELACCSESEMTVTVECEGASSQMVLVASGFGDQSECVPYELSAVTL